MGSLFSITINQNLGREGVATKLKPAALATYQPNNIKLAARCDPGGACQLTSKGSSAYVSYINENIRGIDAIEFER
jgi:hypothetical protein